MNFRGTSSGAAETGRSASAETPVKRHRVFRTKPASAPALHFYLLVSEHQELGLLQNYEHGAGISN